MSPDTSLKLVYRHGFPRVSGDEPHKARESSSASVFSPRERG